jgi:hypothetical protein
MASAIAGSFRSLKSAGDQIDIRQKMQIDRMVDYDPEKAGVGGSTPSLATIFQNDLAVFVK